MSLAPLLTCSHTHASWHCHHSSVSSLCADGRPEHKPISLWCPESAQHSETPCRRDADIIPLAVWGFMPSFSVEFFPSCFARRELRAADVWAVMFLHCHNLRCYSKCCHAQLQCELASRVKELTHRRRLSWHFLESPHASYGGVKWVENVSFL